MSTSRPTPFTPQARRPLSSTSSISSLSNRSSIASITTAASSIASSSSLSLSKKPAQPPTPATYKSTPARPRIAPYIGTTPAPKKYKSALSTESRPRPRKLDTVPGSPAARPRSKTPSTSRPGTPHHTQDDLGMDVSRVDPEDVLVDYQNVGDGEGDVSIDLDAEGGNGEGEREDKVMVSIRIRPTTASAPSAWSPSPDGRSLSLQHPSTSSSSTSTHDSSAAKPNTNHSFTFDAIHTGSANKPIYSSVARSHVRACMRGYNAVVFAYGQTASGKTYTLSGGEGGEAGIIPRALSTIFAHIRSTPEREFLLRCSYLEIYNETIVDLLAPPGSPQVQIHGGGAGSGKDEVVLAPLREEVITSLQAVSAVLARGNGNRRTACTDWNARSSRSHSVFRVVVESRERDANNSNNSNAGDSGRQTPGPASGRQTPGMGGPRLQARGGRSVQSSVLSLIDLAGSEKATTDKERTREGRYINTSLLTLGSVIGTLAENAAKGKSGHVPYRNSKLTRLLQPSLAGNARISVICTINPEKSAVSESLSTLQFAKRVRGVVLNAQKKEVVDTDALIERYRKEIEDLKKRLEERENVDPNNGAEPSARARRLSAREQIDESKAMKDLQTRIQQLTRLILTSASVSVAERSGDEDELAEGAAGESVVRAASPMKVDFTLEPYQLQEELLSARLQIESQATQILSLEAANAMLAQTAASTRPKTRVGSHAAVDGGVETEVERGFSGTEDDEDEDDSDSNILGGLASTPNPRGTDDRLRELEETVRGQTLVIEQERKKAAEERRKREDGERWAAELTRELDREKKMRVTLEVERKALAAFVSKFDALGLGISMDAPLSPVKPVTDITSPPPTLPFADTRSTTLNAAQTHLRRQMDSVDGSPAKLEMELNRLPSGPSLLEEEWDAMGAGEVSFDSYAEGDGDSFAVDMVRG